MKILVTGAKGFIGKNLIAELKNRKYNEKFLVVSGEGLIRFRKIDEDEIIEYRVSGEKLQVVDIPTGYTHSIVNVGETDLVTVMWANEPFNPEKPGTYYLEVQM